MCTLQTFPGVLPYKRSATDKSGLPMFQPGSAAYQQALMQQLGNQSYVPVSCEYGATQPATAAATAVAAAAAANALATENVIPRASSASPTITDITDSNNTNSSNSSNNNSNTSTTTTTSTTVTTINSPASNNLNTALVPVNSSKDSIITSSSVTNQTITNPYHSAAAVAAAAAAANSANMFSYPAGYALHGKTVRPALRAAPTVLSPTVPANVALAPYAFSQPPPPQALGVGYMSGGANPVTMASMMPFASQAPSLVNAGSMAAVAASGLPNMSPYHSFPAGVATGASAAAAAQAAAASPAQFVYSSLHYPMSNYVLPPAANPAATQYNSWAAAAAAQAAAAAAAAAAGTTEQPYKKLKTV